MIQHFEERIKPASREEVKRGRRPSGASSLEAPATDHLLSCQQGLATASLFIVSTLKKLGPRNQPLALEGGRQW